MATSAARPAWFAGGEKIPRNLHCKQAGVRLRIVFREARLNAPLRMTLARDVKPRDSHVYFSREG